MDQHPEKIKLLFLCTGNSCRSQMAEAWTRKLRGNRIEPFSAGTEPQEIDPRAVKVMAEAGLDISGQKSKTVEALGDLEFDYVITLCDSAHQSCPFFPGKTKRLHLGFDDPPRLAAGAGSEVEALAPYRRVRDEIKAFVESLPGTLDS
jgi:arsenate reductase (thioredoxin)